MSDARAAFTEHVDAFNAHDTGRLLAGFTADAVWVTGQDRVAGRAALAELFDDGLWALEPALRVASVVAAGDRVGAELQEWLSVDGELRQFAIAVFVEVADGLIRSAKVYREGSADL